MDDSLVRFENFELDLARGLLRDGQGELELTKRGRRLLCYLVANRDRVVPFDEIRTEVWEGVHVGEAALHQALRQLRRQLGDDGHRQEIIRTFRGVGYRFIAAIAAADVDARSAEPPYIGRTALLEELRRHLDAAFAGRGQLLLLHGEPGIGKSRSAEELLAVARERGALVLRGVSTHSGAPPYWPWPSLLAALSLQRPTAELRREIQEIAPRFLNVASPGGLAPGVDAFGRFRLFDAVARCFARASDHGPVVIWLDDLHEVGTATLELLDYFAGALADARVLVVAAYRRGQALAEPERAAFFQRLEQRSNSAAFEIEPLDADEMNLLVLDRDPPLRTPAFVGLLTKASRGNPFYAIELGRFLRSSLGTANPEAVDWSARVPRGVQHVLSASLAALTPDSRRLLATAACVGEEFEPALLARLEPALDVDAALAQARELGLIGGRSGAPRFAHPLSREAILAEGLHDAEERLRVHLRLGEDALAHSPQRITEAAFHFAAAAPLGDLERTIATLRSAAEVAERVFDDERSWMLLQSALALLRDARGSHPILCCELLVAAGEVAVRGTRADEARGLFREAVSIARSEAADALFCRAALGLAYRDEILGLAEADVAVLLEEALENRTANDPRLRVRLLSALALKLRYEPGSLSRSVALIEESIGLAKAAEDAGSLARALEDASFVHWSVDDPERWIGLNQRIVEAASEAGDRGLLFRGVKGLATGFMEVGERAAMEREFDRCARLAREAPAPYLLGICTLHRGAIAMLDGQIEVGEQCATEALQCGLPAVTQLAAVQLYYHRLETGRGAEFEAPLRSLVESTPWLGTWRYALARLLAETGRADEAREQLELAGSLSALPRDRNWMAAAALGTESALLLGDADRCALLFGTLEPYARVNVVLGHGSLFYGNASHFLGLLAGALGRKDEAEHQLRAGLAMHERMSSPSWVRRSRAALGDLGAVAVD